MTTSIGTASTVPHAPHTQVHNINPRKTTSALIRSALPISGGVSSHPSSVVMTSAAPDICSAWLMPPPCTMPTTNNPPETMTGPKYGIELKTPASTPHIAGFSTPIHTSASHVATPTTEAVR